jgi:hypothetical protein
VLGRALDVHPREIEIVMLDHVSRDDRPPRPEKPTRDGPLRPLPRIAASLLILAVLFVVGRAAVGAWNATWSASVLVSSSAPPADQDLKDEFDLLRFQLRAQVPSDASFYVDMYDPTGLWRQRLAEFAAMSRMYVVTDPAQADYTVTLVTDPSAHGGIRLVARKVR